MTSLRIKIASVILAVSAALVLALVILGPTRQGQSDLAAQAARKPRAPAKPITMPANLIGLNIALGVTDKEATRWDGDVQLSEGKLLELEVAQGGPKAKVDGARFVARTTIPAQKKAIATPSLRVNVDAPPSATVTVNTAQGKFSFALSDLTAGVTKVFLNGKAKVDRQEAAVRLTGPDTEDDFPAAAKSKDGTVWLAYIEYQPGQPIVEERLLKKEFDTLVPKGNGDQVRLVRFDGTTWQPAIDVTDAGLDIWRPTVAVDGKGDVVIAWSQQVDGDYEIFYRRYTPPAKGQDKGQFSDIVRLTKAPGSDFHVVSTTDSAGVVWLAWQAWRKDNYEIMLAALADNHPYKEPRIISTSKANDWSPSIAADSKGNVYVAYDTYDKGNYDVMLYMAGKEPKTITVADSAKVEARPSVVCDAKDRVWIAYEEGDEQWGKDFANNEFQKIGLKSNPGYALYINRTLNVKCLADGKLMQTADDLPKALSGRLPWNKSVPRLAVDAGGGIWLLFRHHPLPVKQGEVWESFALRYNGQKWSTTPRQLPASANLMDNRPALVAFGAGILAVYSGDNRPRTQTREQDDLFATILNPSGPAGSMQLVDAPAAAAAKVPPVHRDEVADVARMRGARVEVGGKQLRYLRGEFHRHTEFTAHNDGDGLMEDAWRYGLDCASMDWMGLGDHDNGFGSEYMWWLSQKMTDLHQNAPNFIAAVTHERSVKYPNGHRNVILPKRGIRPMPRTDIASGSAEKGTPDTKLLYAYLKHFGAICSSHTSGTDMGTDWRDNDPTVEPIVEIYQGHRHNYEEPNAPRHPTKETNIGGYQPAGYVWNAFEKGYRLGFQSSSDHMSTHMSYGVVITDDVSRQGLIDAFKKRHSYGATDNILVDVRSGDHIMGDEFETAQRPTLVINVHGTSPIAKVHVIRNNKYVYTTEPKNAVVKDLRYTDMDAPAGKTSYYYVRVEQADGNLAWASPMWIMYKP